MTERALQNYFEGKITAADLSRDVLGSQTRTSHDTTSVRVIQISEEVEFQVTRKHMLMLCDDAIAGHLSMEDMNTIGFALMTSEHFALNDETEEGAIVSDTAFDWDNPEIGYDLTIENMKRWKARLETGDDLFDPNELKQKQGGK